MKWLLSLVTLSLVAIAADFPEVPNSQPETIVLTASGEAISKVRVPEGFKVTLFAAEPDVRQPISIATDDRGRLWVVENYTYAEAAVNFAEELRDRIVILDDTNSDGVADRRKVFWDQGYKMTSAAIGFGGVYVLCAPHLLFIPDKDRDDVPDGEPEILLDGWDEDIVRHNIVNGLQWGPDGWLYGRHGIQATSLVGKPGDSESQRVPVNCAIWRYHPTRRVFEIVCRGTTNPWGWDYDQHGEMFFINTVIGHLWHAVPGAHYKRMYGADFNPYLYDLIDQCADHVHWSSGEKWNEVSKGMSDATDLAGGGHAHSGMMIYLGANWPERYRNSVFTVNYHGRRLNNDILEREGPGYVARHGEDHFRSEDPWFRGVELLYGPDGGVYIADWSDIGECHESDGVHRTSGRIFKVTYGDLKPGNPFDLYDFSPLELVQLQNHPNDWYARRARRILQERSTGGEDLTTAVDALFESYKSETSIPRKLRALWCLYTMDALSDEWLVGQLGDANEHVRAWAVRLLVDQGSPSDAARTAFERLAASEPSGLVRLYLASALQRIPVEARWELANALSGHTEDANDRSLPLMLWYGVEPSVPGDPSRAVELLEGSRIPLVANHIARRLTEEMEARSESVAGLTRILADTNDPSLRREILQGMLKALEGRRRAQAPKGWERIASNLSNDSDPQIVAWTRELSLVFGDGRAEEELKRIVEDGDADPAARRRALRTLVASAPEGFAPYLQDRILDKVVGAEAIRGLASYDDPKTANLLLDRYREFPPDGQTAAVSVLAARAAYAEKLINAVANGAVPRAAVSAFHARQILGFGDEALSRRLEEVWGKVGAGSEARREQIDKYEALLAPERLAQADPGNGKALFEKTCAVCHVLFGEGKNIGPDLTGGQRDNLQYLLENILDPSAVVAQDFKMSHAFMKDGRLITGVVLTEKENTLSLQTQEEVLTLERDEIEEVRLSEVSLMPEGLLEPLREEEVRDLFGFLMGTGQGRAVQ